MQRNHMNNLLEFAPMLRSINYTMRNHYIKRVFSQMPYELRFELRANSSHRES